MVCLADAWARPGSSRIAARVPRCNRRGRLAAVESRNASVNVETDWQELRTWLVNGGGEVGSVRLGNCKLGNSVVRGLLATETCAAGQTLVTVPLRLAFVDSGVQPPYPGAPWNVALACKLLQEHRQAELSSFRPYLTLLPDAQLTPLSFDRRGIDEIQYLPAMRAVEDYQRTVRGYHDSLAAAGWDIPLEELQWAVCMVQSRSLRMSLLGTRVMLPCIDLLNHGGAAACNGRLGLGQSVWELDGDAAVHFVTTAPIAAGEQVLWTYGDRSNDDFFAYHGFVLQHNPHDDCILFDDLRHAVDWFLEACPLGPQQQQRQQQQQQALLAEVEGAAESALRVAARRCKQPHKTGTASAVLVPLHQPPGARGSRAPKAPSERVLAPFRLHLPEWGASDCSPEMPELLVTADGLVDCRLAAALQHLHGAAPAAAGRLPATWRGLLRMRCEELLAGFPTSREHDEAMLAGSWGLGAEEGLAVQYRAGKKAVLEAAIASCTAA